MIDIISYTFQKNRILTDPSIEGHENVISKVYWTITFFDGTSTSIAKGITDLNTADIENFIPIEEVNDSILARWVIDSEGGEEFIATLKGIHVPMLKRKTEESKLNVYYQDPNYIDTSLQRFIAPGYSGASGYSGYSGS